MYFVILIPMRGILLPVELIHIGLNRPFHQTLGPKLMIQKMTISMLNPMQILRWTVTLQAPQPMTLV